MTYDPPSSLPEPAPAAPPPPPPPAAPAAKRGRWPVVLVVIGLLLTCGLCVGGVQLITYLVNQDDWEDLGEPVPETGPVVLPTPSWEPPNPFVDPQPTLEIRHDLEARVLAVAVVPAEVTSSCDDPDYLGLHATTLTCTVTYQGLDVVFTVSARPTSDQTFEWEASTTELVVTREGILSLFWTEVGPDGFGHTDLRCEPGLPELALVAANERLPQYCYARQEGESKTVRFEIVPAVGPISATLRFESEFQD